MAKRRDKGGRQRAAQARRRAEGGRQKAEPNVPAVVCEAGLPLWTPAGLDLERVPEEVQLAAREIVQPVYEQFVVRATDGLEKSLGVTIAHLLWLEILEQFDMKREYVTIDAVLGLPGNRHEAIAQHLRLVAAKVRVGYFLLRIRQLREQAAAMRASPVGRQRPVGSACRGRRTVSADAAGRHGYGAVNTRVPNPEPRTPDVHSLDAASGTVPVGSPEP